MNIKRILALLLSALAVVCLLSGCAKEEEERELKEVIEAPVDTPDNKDDDKIEYKEEFYFYNGRSHEQYMLGLTDTEYRLVMVENLSGYTADFIEIEGTYTVEENGDYVLDRMGDRRSKLFFSEYVVDNGEFETKIEPIVVSKRGDIYVTDEYGITFVKKGETQNKTLYLDGATNDYDLVVNQGDTARDMGAYLIDGATGIGEYITLAAENFTEFDTSTVGETTVKVTYEDVTYELKANVRNPITFYSTPSKYKLLTCSDGLPLYVTPDTAYESYFEAYEGDEPLFYFGSGNGKKAVTEYTVDGWNPTEVKSGEKMYYRVNATVDGAEYRYVGFVYVCAQRDENKGSLSSIDYADDDLTVDGFIWYVPKGHDIEGVKATFTAINGAVTENTEVAVADYDSGKTGPQTIKLTYGDAVYNQMVFVYDEDVAVITDIELTGLRINVEGTAVDYTETSIKFTYCNGTERIAASDGYKSSIKETVQQNGDIEVEFIYNAVYEGVGYPFVVTETVVAQTSN